MPKIDLRQAAQSVRDYIIEFNDILENNLEGVMIEETELSEDEKFWLITIGFNREIDLKEERKFIGSPLFTKPVTIKRDYKIFKVDSSTGEVISMKMYKL